MRRALLLSIAGLLLLAGDARACSCVGPEVDKAHVVFVGRAVELSDDRAVFDVERSVKGGYAGRVELPYFPGDGGNCGAMLSEGERTAVLLYPGRETVGLCNVADPALLGFPAPPPASLLGTLLGTCWSVIR